MSILLLGSLTTAVAAGFIVISYEFLARQNTWPVGKLFMNMAFQVIFGGLSILGAILFAFIYISFFWGLGILAVGWILAFLLSMIFKTYVQWIAILLLFVSWGMQFFI